MRTWFVFTFCCYCAIMARDLSRGKLVGDNICQTQISEPVETTVWTLKNRTVRSYRWCLNVPPRCSSYATVEVNETQTLISYVNRTVDGCCEGYRRRDDKCVDEEGCEGCRNGVCRGRFCDCHQGWTGPSCDILSSVQTIINHSGWNKNANDNVTIEPIFVTRQKDNDVSRRNLFLGIASISAVTVVVSVTAVGLLILKLLKRNADKRGRDKKGTSVAVYATSIFHTPLPDPPPFENPTYYSIREEIALREFRTGNDTVKRDTLPNLTWRPDVPLSISKSTQAIEPLYDEIPSRETPLYVQNSTLPPKSSSTYANS